jgi:hypothetical protein
MKTGAFFLAGVEMKEFGAGPPAPTDRRYPQEEIWYAQERMLDIGSGPSSSASTCSG